MPRSSTKKSRSRRNSDDFVAPAKTKKTSTQEAKSTTPKTRKSTRLGGSSDEVNNSSSTPTQEINLPKKSIGEATKDKNTKKRGRSKSPAPKVSKKKTTEDTSPTMDTRVHRLRHLEYIPSPILSMSSQDEYLAISREDGSYELSVVSSVEDYQNKYNPHIYPVSKIAGSTLAVAHSLCWVPKATEDAKPLCVAASPDGTLWVANFAQSQLQSRLSSGGGGIFDLAICQSSELPVVATACQDGFVRLWQALPNGTIRDPPIATLSTAGAAILSLTWRLVKQQSGTYESVLFTGVADGTIRKYKVDLEWKYNFVSVIKHATVLRMTMETKGRRTSTKVWTMKLLQDGTLISGNSLGQVQFWNSETGTLIQSIFQSNLKSDVLQIAVKQDETKIFCTGVDSRVICCERPSYKQPVDVTSPWVLTNAQRPHTHDVKAMVLVTSDDGRVEALATGGVDTKLCSYVASDFSKRRPHVWYPWPSNSPISTAPEHRIFSMQRQDKVELYRLNDTDDNFIKTRNQASEMVGNIKIETKTNLVISSLSANCKWMALSDASTLHVFGLKFGNGNEFIPEQVELPEQLSRIATTAMHFDQDTLYLAEPSSNKVYVVDLTSMDYSIISVSTNSRENLPIHSLHTDGDFLVTLSHVKDSGVRIFKRSSSSSRILYTPYWSIPSLSNARPAAVTLIQGKQLAIATFASHLYVFDLYAKRLTPWSEQYGFPIRKWPSELTSRRDFPVRLIVNPSSTSQIILASFGTFCVINLDGRLPEHCQMLPESHVRRRKRLIQNQSNSNVQSRVKRTMSMPKDPDARNCVICLHYNSMLYMNFLGPNEMIVIEQPWLQVVATFPEALQRRVYGCA